MNPIFMVAGMLVVWAIAFVVFITLQMKRKNAEAELVAASTTKAIVHFYGDVSAIDGQDAAIYHPIKGQMLDTIVALEPGHHTFVGSFQMTENGIVVKNKNYYATDIEFEFDVKMGKVYRVGLYKNVNHEEKVTMTLPLTESGFGAKTLYLIAYNE
ncbi:hypothetical protein [uncultured Solobacterium sp.]|jgi:hypothetical protein|uniref:hypothetical protein n=1 Tax=uncultured Solobacterium sp. TaxID=747375 RepID=UPI0025F7907D|nr:hypothetical protein [uncultured Solobacterium sp.]